MKQRLRALQAVRLKESRQSEEKLAKEQSLKANEIQNSSTESLLREGKLSIGTKRTFIEEDDDIKTQKRVILDVDDQESDYYDPDNKPHSIQKSINEAQ